MSHYYTQDGKPCHTQPTKKGAKNPTRPTTIADVKKMAKEEGIYLLPSITGITAMLANEGLTYYKQMMVAEEAFKRPPIAGKESSQQYAKIIIDLAAKPAEEAADLGSKIHGLLEAHGKGEAVDMEEMLTFPSTGEKVPVKAIVEPVLARVASLGVTALGHEVVALNAEHGYAGTLDMPWSTTEVLGLMDYKTSKTKPGEPVTPRLSYAMQLAAGLAAFSGKAEFTHCRAQNIFISTTEPGRVDVIEYNGKELAEAWEAFKACLVLWRTVNKHDPRKGASQ